MGGPPLTTASDPAGPPFLLDTHIWIWHVSGSERLPVGLRDAIDAAIGQLWLSPISVWEVGMLNASGRIELAGGTRRWVEQALTRLPLNEATLAVEVALRSHEVKLGHRDPADHLLAATALVHDLTLVSVDERLVVAPDVRVRSA